MNKLVNEFNSQSNLTTTENGAIAFNSTLNACLDAFGSLGAMYNSSEEDIIQKFALAYDEDKEKALRMLFYIRDPRGGIGARRVFRVILNWLAKKEPEVVIANIDNIAIFGRYDDVIISLRDTPVENFMVVYISDCLHNDLKAIKSNKPVSLLGKWLPSENTSSKKTRELATWLRTRLGFTSKQYRLILTTLRSCIGVVEQKMSANQWDNIDYSKVSGKAALNYADAFAHHDKDRYIKYLYSVLKSDKKINATTLMPHEILNKAITAMTEHSDSAMLMAECMWKNQPDYFKDHNENCMCMVDTSGSMNGTPKEVAIALGLYCADKCKGPFHNHFMMFDEKPYLVNLSGDFESKVRELYHYCVNATNTDIAAAFDKLLQMAIDSACSQEDFPTTLYIISDMQFDCANGSNYGQYYYSYHKVELTDMNQIKAKYEYYGYKLPNIVYWNVRASDCGMYQVKYNDVDCALVSGYSSALFKAVMEGTVYEEEVVDNKIHTKAKLDPMAVMNNAIMNSKYDRIVTSPDEIAFIKILLEMNII